MTDNLAPCPFCGGEPKLRTHRSGEDSMECYVECPSCEVRTTCYEDAYAPVADAAGAWNRRTALLSTPKTEVFTVGDQTMEKVFKPTGLTNLHDLQAVLDAVERALTPPPSSHVAGDATLWVSPVDLRAWQREKAGEIFAWSENVEGQCVPLRFVEEPHSAPSSPVAWVADYTKSDGTTDYYVMIGEGERAMSLHMHSIRGRAEYEAAEINHALTGSPKPELDEFALDTATPSPQPREVGGMNAQPERIVAAAIHFGAILSLPPPARHGDIIASMDTIMGIDGPLATPDRQGFITDTGRYVNRVEAYGIAYRSGQLLPGTRGPQLFSEDLW